MVLSKLVPSILNHSDLNFQIDWSRTRGEKSILRWKNVDEFLIKYCYLIAECCRMLPLDSQMLPLDSRMLPLDSRMLPISATRI